MFDINIDNIVYFKIAFKYRVYIFPNTKKTYDKIQKC